MPQSGTNRLLELLPRDDLNGFRRHLEDAPFTYKMSLYKANEPIEYVYFPIEGVASLVMTMKNGSAAEVGTIGNEGIVGVPVILGGTTSPTEVYVQVEGRALRLKASVFTRLLDEHGSARTLMLRYVHAFFNQVAQSAACNHFHRLDQRACRWILMTHDRVQTETFPLTQEFLAMMLGVRRTGVTEAAQTLKKKQLIKYSRGHVTILDRAGLEKCSCECYGVAQREYDHLLGAPKPHNDPAVLGSSA